MGFLIFVVVLVFIGFHGINLYAAQARMGSRENLQSQGAKALKPDINAFLFYKVIKTSIFWLIALLIIYFGINAVGSYIEKAGQDGFKISISIVWILLAAVIGLRYLALVVCYKKTKYLLYPKKIVQKGGGIFSDFEKELSLKNITHVDMVLPFIENKLFGTGHLRVESAGAGTTEVSIVSMKNAEEAYESIIGLMKQNGFRLTRQNLIQKERPHNLAIFFEVFSYFIGALFFISYMGSGFFVEKDIDVEAIFSKYGSLLVGGLTVVLLGVLAYCIMRFLDLKQRVYSLYEDTVTYSEGFLNKHYSIIPFENLADSAISQSFISKIFGLYDVKLSCQGSGQEILFKNMINGQKLSDNIDKLVDKSKSLVDAGEKEEAKAEKSGITERRKAKPESDREYQAEFKMDPFRTWLPLIILSPLLLILFPLLIVGAIAGAVRLKANTFKIKKDSAVHIFEFFSKHTTEFSFDKVTGIIFKKGIIDRWCKTCKTVFWSIGSGANISFPNLKEAGDFKNKILGKKGIKPQKVLYELASKFNFVDMLKANIYFFSLILIAAIALFAVNPGAGVAVLISLAVLILIVSIYKGAYYQRSKLMFYEDYVHFSHGLFWREDFYVFYDDIKDITTLRYPGSSLGNIKFNVAGETVIKTRQSESIRPNAFTIRYIDKIKNWDELIDIVFYYRPQAEKIKELENNPRLTSPEVIYSSKPSLANGLSTVVFGLFVLDIILGFITIAIQAPTVAAALIIFLNIIILSWATISIKVISYILQPYRIYEKKGIIFKKQTSVTYNKIDFINFHQGALNKAFKTGNITINTIGSSRPEIVIKNISDYKRFYDKLKQEYAKE